MAGKRLAEELAGGVPFSIVGVVDALVADASEMRASDIHLDPQDEGVRVRYRIDGNLQDVEFLPRDIHAEIITRIKILSALRTDEHQAAQDGRFRVAAKNPGAIDVRVSIAPTYYGENAVLRLLSDQAEEFTLESLGIALADQKKISRAISRPYGMILATGPTGSGKTTSLYSLLKILNTKEVSIVTIEDPIEYAVSGIEQIQVNPRTGLNFANGLRSILRQDPNIIMVGEIRDAETAGIAVNTALTGHLLLSSLHTNDAATTLPRLLDLKVEPYLIASTVNVAIGQRLVRKICATCRTKKELTAAERKSLEDSLPERYVHGKTFFAGGGCDECNRTGYRGRVGLYEVLLMDPVIREGFLRKASASEINQLAIQQGMRPMLHDGLEKAAAGITTIEEVLRILHE